MLTKQFGTLHVLILAGILVASLLIGLGVIVFLDKALIARTVSQRESQQGAPAQSAAEIFAADQIQTRPTLGAAEARDAGQAAPKKSVESENTLKRTAPAEQ